MVKTTEILSCVNHNKITIRVIEEDPPMYEVYLARTRALNFIHCCTNDKQRAKDVIKDLANKANKTKGEIEHFDNSVVTFDLDNDYDSETFEFKGGFK